MLGRMRLDGLTETTVPFAERLVLLWRRGAPTPEMTENDLVDVLKVWPASCSVLMRRARRSSCLSKPAVGAPLPEPLPATSQGVACLMFCAHVMRRKLCLLKPSAPAGHLSRNLYLREIPVPAGPTNARTVQAPVLFLRGVKVQQHGHENVMALQTGRLRAATGKQWQ